MSPPQLRTILDLHHQQLVEVDAADPFMQVLLHMAQREKDPRVTGSAKQVREDIFGTEFDTLSFGARVYVARLAAMAPAAQYSATLGGLVTALANNHPATAVLWAHATAAHWARTGQPATVASLVLRRLDGCLPGQPALRQLWLAQKLSRPELLAARQQDSMASDNHLDYAYSWSPPALADSS